jgi:hypothetical protein
VASYTFLPWARRGLGTAAETVDPLGAPSALGERAVLRVSFRVSGEPVARDVALAGPGDVLGINPRAIVRTEPRGWITDFESNYLAFVEFYDEDFPWRYTPARATPEHRLRPWLALVVLTEEEFQRPPGLAGPLPRITLAAGVVPFPPPDQSWAWAHVHVSQDVTAGGTRPTPAAVEALQAVVRDDPDAAYSRLLCPRRLEANTGYHAFLVPAFETGRLAGLGLATAGVDGLRPSWGAGQSDFPVYYEWFFRTGDRGDFELLANLLEPRPVDDRVGVRDMDMQVPDFGVPGLGDPPVMGLEGALRKPGAVPRPAAWPPTPLPAFVRGLRDRVNRQAEVLDPAPGVAPPDPVISPPLYGRWHAMVDRLEPTRTGWVTELNGDPRLRVPAGLGGQVIRIHQDDYMSRAWAQLGDVLAANQLIRRAQLALAASHRLFTRSLLPLPAGQLMATTHAVLGRIRGSRVTLHEHVRQSRLPLAALRPAFRKLARPRGALMRKVAAGPASRLTDVLARLNDGRITAAAPHTAPARQISLASLGARVLPGWLPAWLIPWLRQSRWIVAGLAVVTLVALPLLGPATVAVAGAGLLAVAFFAERLRGAVLAADHIMEERLTARAVASLPPRPDFVVTDPGSAPPAAPAPVAAGTDSPEAASFRTALADLHGRFEIAVPRQPPKAPLDLDATALRITQAINPVRTIPARVWGVVAVSSPVAPAGPAETIVPIMAHPAFADPMYAPLRDISAELLVPNLGFIADNTICLLETNRRFVEAYMVGLNHEMGRELLWRRHPSDQRGSYFRQFWDVRDVVSRDPGQTAKAREEALRDITAIHTWGRATDLGTHENRDLPSGAEPDAPRLVLAIRGQLLKKYPTTVVFAQKARWGTDELGRSVRLLDPSAPDQNLREPLFKAEIHPDIHFLGFDLTAAEAKGQLAVEEADPGWFFVLQERPGEPRFGLDLPTDETPEVPAKWDELAWTHLAGTGPLGLIDLDAGPTTEITTEPDRSVAWGASAAEMAYILYQAPVMVAFHARDMLE